MFSYINALDIYKKYFQYEEKIVNKSILSNFIDKYEIDIAKKFYEIFIVVIMTLIGGLQAINQYFEADHCNGFLKQILILVFFSLLLKIFDILFIFFSKFIINIYNSFNKIELTLLKILTFLSFVMEVFLYFLLLYLKSNIGKYWWLWFFCIVNIQNIILLLFFILGTKFIF
ncbi:MAG: hypothetical protein IR526_01510 [Bordetella sp.]|nr:MAG: hypothetical protein IR526_01510 [Bordetella sp.]